MFASVVMLFICFLFIKETKAFSRTLRIVSCMSLDGRTSFLGEKPDVYAQTCLRLALDGCKNALKDQQNLLEIEFPALLKNDISVSETLNANRRFVRKFCDSFKEYGKDLWVIFPDQGEASLARKDPSWGESLPFTLSSISGAMLAPADAQPKLIIAVNPGFNIDEWIDLPKIQREGCPMIVINGNLDRLRNGYYPQFIYPGLAKVTKGFYVKFAQVIYSRSLFLLVPFSSRIDD